MTPLSEHVETITGGRIVVEMLRALGVEVVFGVPGGQTLAITDAILDEPQIRFVTARHEGGAACMADAAGRLTGRPAVCLATTGPGATNLLTGVGGAFRDSSPMIVITCNNRLPDLDRDDAQAADHVAIFRPLVKWAKLVSHPATITQVLQEAYLRATTGCPGPVLVDFARDVLEGAHDPALLDGQDATGASLDPQGRVTGDPSRVRAAAAALSEARSPVLWLGNGAKLSRAGDAALRLARRLDAPVITTFNGIGAVATTDEHVFGPLSRMGTELSTRVLGGADVVVAVGNSLNAISTSRWSLNLPPTIIQIDLDPTVIGRYYGSSTTGIVGDAGAVLDAITAAVDDVAGDPGPVEARRSRLQRLAEARLDWWERASLDTDHRDGTIAPDAVIRSARAVTPDDAIAVFDAGNPGVWSYIWEIRRAGTYLKPVGFGNMGFAVPAAVGASVVASDTPIVAFVGDGSLGMSLGELETLVREQTNACIVVMNDSGYGNIRQEQLIHFGERTIGVDFGDVDYAAVARACGMPAVRVTDADALADAVAEAMGRPGPSLVEAMIDPDINAWTFPLFRQFEVEE